MSRLSRVITNKSANKLINFQFGGYKCLCAGTEQTSLAHWGWRDGLRNGEQTGNRQIYTGNSVDQAKVGAKLGRLTNAVPVYTSPCPHCSNTVSLARRTLVGSTHTLKKYLKYKINPKLGKI